LRPSSTNEYLGASAGPEGLNVAWNQVVSGTPESVYRRLPLSDFPTPSGSGNGDTTPTTPPAPSKPPTPKGKPKPKVCRRALTLVLPVRGGHPDIDGDRDDGWKAVDAAVLSDRKLIRAMFPKHGELRRTVTVTVTGRGRLTVKIVEETRSPSRRGRRRRSRCLCQSQRRSATIYAAFCGLNGCASRQRAAHAAPAAVPRSGCALEGTDAACPPTWPTRLVSAA
jgi:hypothetical protein